MIFFLKHKCSFCDIRLLLLRDILILFDDSTIEYALHTLNIMYHDFDMYIMIYRKALIILIQAFIQNYQLL